MYSVDRSGFKKYLLNFHEQISGSKALLEAGKIHFDAGKIKSIVVLGMGGSAIGGNLLSDIFFDELTVPITVVRSYIAPAFCGPETLVVISSYSGNTEETLSALNQIAGSGAVFIVISSGGELTRLAEQNNWGLIRLPAGYPPRQAMGFLFFPLYHLLGSQGFFKTYTEDLSRLAHFARDLAEKYDYPGHPTHNLARELATSIKNKIPVLYSTAPYLTHVSVRWRNQMHENAKSLAFSNVLPEMNHNEIVGWDMPFQNMDKLIVIMLENTNPLPRLKKRILVTKKLIAERGVEVVDIYSDGDCMLERVFSLVILGDWVSYHLAIAYQTDPMEIKNIDYLKEELKKFVG